MKKRNKKYILFFIASLICSVLFIFFRGPILDWIKIVISNDFFILSISLLVFLIVIWHKIKYKEIGLENFKNLESARELLTEVMSLISEPSIFVCSISMLRGLFLDYFFDDKYFYKFNQAEKSFLCIASFYFLITTFTEIKTYAVELFFDSAEPEDSGQDEDIV